VSAEDVWSDLIAAFGRGAPDSGTAVNPDTDEELRKALEHLAEHASQVDQMIQDEESQAVAAGGDRGVGPEGEGIAGGGDLAEAGGPDEPGEMAGYTDSGSGGATGSQSSVGSHPAPPPDVGNGNDDDTFAAQIREIAMNEPDPELRELYWEEYRRYKGLKSP